MNVAKLRIIQEVVRNVPDEQWDMQVWQHKEACGTVGCAIGHSAKQIGLHINITPYRECFGKTLSGYEAVGHSGTGKTYSALRLATGLADGGKIGLIDTENGRGPDGLKCAAGHLIADEHYSDTLEGRDASSDDVCDALRMSLPNAESKFLQLIYAIQQVHDYEHVSVWPEKFAEVAESWKLNTEVVDAHRKLKGL